MFGLILALTVLIGTGLASYIDLTREDRIIPDSIAYSMIAIGIIVKALQAYLNNDYWILGNSVITGMLFFGFGALMYYSRQWGGGDAKLLAAIGVLLSTYPLSHPVKFGPWPFQVSLFVNILIAGAGYGVGSLFYLLAKDPKLRTEVVKIFQKRKLESMLVVAFSLGSSLPFFLIGSLFGLFGIYVLSLWFLLRIAKVVEQSMIVDRLVTKLTEGDVPVREIKVGGEIIATKHCPGLSIKQINRLKELYAQGKISKVKIREGIPFVPSFLIGIILTLLFGDLISWILI